MCSNPLIRQFILEPHVGLSPDEAGKSVISLCSHKYVLWRDVDFTEDLSTSDFPFITYDDKEESVIESLFYHWSVLYGWLMSSTRRDLPPFRRVSPHYMYSIAESMHYFPYMTEMLDANFSSLSFEEGDEGTQSWWDSRATFPELYQRCAINPFGSMELVISATTGNNCSPRDWFICSFSSFVLCPWRCPLAGITHFKRAGAAIAILIAMEYGINPMVEEAV